MARTANLARRAERLEDAEWLADSGESAESASVRLGFAGARGLLDWLHKHGRDDLRERFVANSPYIRDAPGREGRR